MRIEANQSKNQGSVLLVTLCTAWVIGIALVSYLTLVANQNRTTYHSQSWSGCIPVLEAGIEEALTQLNYNNGEGTTNATAHGWTLADGLYTKSGIVGPAIDGIYYEVTIDPNTAGTPATPIIISKGYVPAPGNTGTPMGGDTAFGMILGTVGQSTPAMISRTVKVGTRRQSSQGPPGGLIAKSLINMSGEVIVDSFDSSDTNSFPNGKYVAANRKAGAKVLTNISTYMGGAAIRIGGGDIYGSVSTGPGAGTVSIANTGAVGDANWNSTGVNGLTGLNRIQTGQKTGDANVQFDDVTEPFTFGNGSTPVFNEPTQPPVGGTNYNWVLDAAVNSKFNYRGNMTIYPTQRMVVTGGAVTLYVDGSFLVNGGIVPAFVYVAPGASLKLYVTGTASVSGGGMVNGSGRASSISLYGLPTSLNFAVSGTGAFIGTVYAPSATLTLSGNAGAFGSFSANAINMSLNANVHYDESLRVGTSNEFIATTWNEI